MICIVFLDTKISANSEKFESSIVPDIIAAPQMTIRIFRDFRGKNESIFYTPTYYCHALRQCHNGCTNRILKYCATYNVNRCICVYVITRTIIISVFTMQTTLTLTLNNIYCVYYIRWNLSKKNCNTACS